MALIVITVQDVDGEVAIGVQAEPQPPRVVSKNELSPAQQVATTMLNAAQSQQPAGTSIVIAH